MNFGVGSVSFNDMRFALFRYVAVYFNAASYRVQVSFSQNAFYLYEVSFRHLVRGMRKLLRQFAVRRHYNEPFAIVIESADRINSAYPLGH